MVASSFAINSLSHEQQKKGFSSEVPAGCFAEGNPLYLNHHFAEAASVLVRAILTTSQLQSWQVKTMGTAQPPKQILHHLKRHTPERESTGKSRAALALSRWPFLAAKGHFRRGMLLNQLEEPVINGRC